MYKNSEIICYYLIITMVLMECLLKGYNYLQFLSWYILLLSSVVSHYRMFVFLRAAYLSSKYLSLSIPIFEDPILCNGLVLAQTSQAFDVIFAAAKLTRTNWFYSFMQVYSRLFILFGSLWIAPNVLLSFI